MTENFSRCCNKNSPKFSLGKGSSEIRVQNKSEIFFQALKIIAETSSFTAFQIGVFMGRVGLGWGISRPRPILETQAHILTKPDTGHKCQAQAMGLAELGPLSVVQIF